MRYLDLILSTLLLLISGYSAGNRSMLQHTDLGITGPLASLPSCLVPKYSGIGIGFFDHPFNRPFADTLKCVQLTFDHPIELTKKPKAYIRHGNKKVVKASSYEIRNYISEKACEGNLNIFFPKKCLPRHEEYSFCLDSASVYLIDNPIVLNSPISYAFSVPEDMGESSMDMYENGCKIESAYVMSCSWGYVARAVGNPEWELYREGVLIGKYPASVSSDWNLGSAFLDFGQKFYFDEGVKYRLVLPAGSVCTTRRDIVNKEVILDFTGSHAEPKNIYTK